MLCCYCGRTIVKRQASRAHQRGNGSGTAWRRGKTWTAVATVSYYVDDDGKKHQLRRTKSGFRMRNEALDYCKTLKLGTAADRPVPKLDEYWRLYSQGDMLKLSASKQCAYRIAWKRCKSIMYTPVDRLTVSDLRSVVSNNATTYYPARDMKSLLSHLFTLAAADRNADRDLPDFIILPELNEKERTPFTDEEQAALWRLYDSGDHRAALPLIMIYTGMMPGEMQALRHEMVDIEHQRITGVGMKTKVRKSSPIYLPDTIVPVIIDEMDSSSSKTGFVWARSEDRFYKDYYAALAAAGTRRLEPYSCRHTTDTALAITENIAPQTIKKIMRWSTTKMLDRYAHPDDADVLDAVNTFKRVKDD